mgnify:CR=1 FL=1|tara:strand:+ start:12509 stop:13462 length:954 start_codon:yes stop_codon:yes gene_type:complete
MISRLILYLFLSAISLNILSHEMNPARLIVEELSVGKYKATWMYPLKNNNIESEVTFSNCKKFNDGLPKLNGKYLVDEMVLDCDSSMQGQSISIKGLSRSTDALVAINYLDKSSFQGLVTVNDSSIIIPSEISIYPTSYFRLGIEHLLSGFDHILFIFGLLFIILGLGTLIKTITAFTVAHSITLAVSALGIFSLPQLVTESLIALTLIYLALEIDQKTLFKTTPWFFAFGFGLLHGFGFAGALTEIGIANENLAFSLLFFNLGIEVGQLLILAVFGISIIAFKYLNIGEFVHKFSSYFIGGVGSFWLIERILSILN